MVHSASTEPAQSGSERTPQAGFDTPFGAQVHMRNWPAKPTKCKAGRPKTPKNIAEQKFGDMNLLVEQTWKKDIPQKAFKCLLRLHFRCYFMESKWKQAFGCLESRVGYRIWCLWGFFLMQHDHTELKEVIKLFTDLIWFRWAVIKRSDCLVFTEGSKNHQFM